MYTIFTKNNNNGVIGQSYHLSLDSTQTINFQIYLKLLKIMRERERERERDREREREDCTKIRYF